MVDLVCYNVLFLLFTEVSYLQQAPSNFVSLASQNLSGVALGGRKQCFSWGGGKAEMEFPLSEVFDL